MSFGSRAGLALGGLLLLVATLHAGVSGLAWNRLEGVDGRWAKSPGPLPDYAARYPKQETNRVAHELEALAARLGVDLTPGKDAGDRPSPAARRAHDEARPAVQDWLNAELGRAEETLGPPPEAARTWLNANGAALDALAARLLEGPAPRWRQDVSLLSAAPLPNLLGHLSLSRLLVASSLLRTLEGAADADRPLRAAWALTDPLRERPETISRLIHFAGMRLVAGALRKVPADPVAWRGRLSTLDPRALLNETLLCEAWVAREVSRQGAFSGTAGLSARVPLLAVRPLLRLGAARLLEDHRRLLLAARDAPVTDGDPKAVARAAGLADRRPGLWGLQLMDVGGVLRRTDRLVVDLELTDRVLLSRELRRQGRSDTPWAARVDGFSTSRLANASWSSSVGPDGRITISLSRETSWPGQTGLHLPTRFVSRG